MRRSSRRWFVVAAAALVGLVLCSGLGLIALYPRLGAWAIRSKVVPRLEARLARSIVAGDIEVARGSAVLRDIAVSGEHDADGAALARIDRVVVEFDFWSTLTGDVRVHRVTIEGVQAEVVRHDDGSDNVSDLARALGLKPPDGGADPAPDGEDLDLGGVKGLVPELIVVRGAALVAHDRAAGVQVIARDIDADIPQGGEIQVTMAGVEVSTGLGPAARAERVQVRADVGDPIGSARVTLAGGELALQRGISLSSIAGTVERAGSPGRLGMDLRGSYGGAVEELWQARGWVEPRAGQASVRVAAERFTFDRLDSILQSSVLVDYHETSISAALDIEVADGRMSMAGTFDLGGVHINHPMLAEKPVRDLDMKGLIEASLDSATRTLHLARADLTVRGVEYRLSGEVSLPGGIEPAAPGTPAEPVAPGTPAEPAAPVALVAGGAAAGDPDSQPGSGARREHARLQARLSIPPVPCQTMLEGLPEAMRPYLSGFRLGGQFRTELAVAIDWAELEATTLDGGVGIFGCKVLREPEGEYGLGRLEGSFKHYVEVEQETWIEFVVGPENPDFVPLWDVSPHLLHSLMNTEDARYYDHRGFIVREFRTALIKNLQAGYFRYGASSITMQTVKNVLLYREKTLARKLQELFLTWYIETRLDKDRIFEIYVNAIEYGPGLYGIGPAARHYFGKHPRDLNPVEAAFFSSILPAPKPRYRQFCEDRLTRWTAGKIQRILRLMHRRGHLSDEEYAEAVDTPLVFDRSEAPSVRECKLLVRRAIANSRPTNPMKR